MKLEFQDDLLKFLVQRKEARKYIEILEPDLFDLDSQKTVFQLLKGFVKNYNSLPSLGNLLEYFDREVKSKKFDGEDLTDVYETIENGIRDSYKDLTANTDQIREIVLESYQLKLLRKVFVENAAKLKSGDENLVREVFREITKINNIAQNDLEEDENKGRFALSQFQKGVRATKDASPTYLQALNDMTASKGFYSPQLVVFMGAPKSFKTGTLLNIAMNYVRSGKKVFYVDCENGEDKLLDRFYQAMLEATWFEYASGDLDDVLEQMVKGFMMRGGDFRCDFFPAHTKSLADVEAVLMELKEEHGWIPDLICYDYLDLMLAKDYKIKDKRLIIQANYFDAIALQKKWGMFGISLSQVNKAAVNQRTMDMTAFAEDFGKAANCHAAFALCRDEFEKAAGVMRITPVVQRDGVGEHSKAACFVDIKESHMSVKEIDYEEWQKRVKDKEVEVKSNTKRPKRPNKYSKSIKDE